MGEAELEPVRSLWVGEALPAASRACMASFLRVGHPFELFTYGEVAGVPEGVRVRRAEDILGAHRVFRYGSAAGPGAGGLSGFSNLFRYALLVREGGYWVDTDEFCLRPFPTDPVVIGSERRKDGSAVPNVGVLKVPRGHSLAYHCLELAGSADPASLPHGATGPGLIAQAVEQFRMHSAVAPPEAFCDVDWHDFESLARPGTLNRRAMGIHLWAEMWRRKAGGIPWPGPEGSILRQLADLG
ncbi:MAG TPA: glycosyltransferase [Phycisphaerales bacterium]|nr:glycosyltransferase [Phycisphaerales bacterium]